jgi:hypothetical protein
MNILERMSDTFKVVRKFSVEKNVSGALIEEQIKTLEKTATIPLPEEYLQFIRDMGQVLMTVKDEKLLAQHEKHLHINDAFESVRMVQDYSFEDYIPGSIVIGDDEWGGVLIYLVKDGQLGVYMVENGGLDIDETVYIAPSLEAFLTQDVGVDAFLLFPAQLRVYLA